MTAKTDAAISAQRKKKANPLRETHSEEELTTFTLAPGYVAELVAF